MRAWDYGFIDNDQVTDLIIDVSHMARVDFFLVNYYDQLVDYINHVEKDEEGKDPQIMSTKDAKDHLDNGNFDRVFNELKTGLEYNLLCVFVGKCMEVGAVINKEQIEYMKKACKNVEPSLMLFGDKQMELALEEYKSGEPYFLRRVDENGELYKDSLDNKDDPPAGEEGADKLEGDEKRKVPSEDAGDLEEPAPKRAKV